ncbi:MAG: hypothetical protein HY562_07305 [Ignavibacteriales bacterium]|nr:hypothetical protein [Ignavibacteriales bacterium]
MSKHDLTYVMVFFEGFSIALAAFLGSVAIMYVYSILVSGVGVTDWEWCLRYSLALGVVVPWVRRSRKSLARLVKHGHLLS